MNTGNPSEVPVVIGTIRKIDDHGRVSFPKELLAEVGLATGDTVAAYAYAGQIHLQKRDTEEA